MGCDRCGARNHETWQCPEDKRDLEIQKQTDILRQQERQLAEQTQMMKDRERKITDEARKLEKQRRAEEKVLKKSDPNYKSTSSKLIKYVLWFFGFLITIALIEKFIQFLGSISWWQWLLGGFVIIAALYLIGKKVKDT